MEILARVPIFKSLTAQERNCLIVDEVEFFQAEAGEHIIQQGDTDHYFYILLSGHLAVTKNANQAPIATIEPGDFVGEIGFITNQPRTANVAAIEDSMLIRVDQTVMKILPIRVREQIKDKMINGLVERMNHLNDEVILLHDQLESQSEALTTLQSSNNEQTKTTKHREIKGS